MRGAEPIGLPKASDERQPGVYFDSVVEALNFTRELTKILRRKKAVPTAVATSLDVGLSNLSLRTISLSFYSTWLGLN